MANNISLVVTNILIPGKQLGSRHISGAYNFPVAY
jgi:hypothetical protein